MRHEWIFEVLKDLRAYALANGLPDLAAKADEALRVAKAEVAAKGSNPEPEEGGNPPIRRTH